MAQSGTPSTVFLVDADVWSKARPGRCPRIRAWYNAIGPQGRCLAWCTLQELLTGGYNAVRLPAGRATRRHLAFAIATLRTEAVLLPTVPVVAECARLRAEPDLRNLWTTHPDRKLPKSGADVDLAAIARVTGMPIATENPDDFKLIADKASLPGVFVPSTGLWEIPRGS